jgi:hypothetical protein
VCNSHGSKVEAIKGVCVSTSGCHHVSQLDWQPQISAPYKIGLDSSQKQRVVDFSSCQAEYIAGTSAACQGVWLARLLEEMMGSQATMPQIMMDNMPVIALSKNPVLQGRTKHIRTKYHFIRKCVDRGEIVQESVGTTDQLANILMKPLTRVCFQDLRGRISVIKLTGN